MDPKVLKTLEYDKIVRKLADCADTAAGKQRTEQLQPSGQYETVLDRLAFTDEAVKVERLKSRPPFGGIKEIRAALKRSAIGGILGAEELLDIADTIRSGRRLKTFLADFHEEHPVPRLATLFEPLADHAQVEKHIRACINDHAEVVDSASGELSRIRREMRAGEASIREKLDQMVRSSATRKKLQDQGVTIRNGRYVIPVKQEHRSDFGGMIHDQSASGATLFIEPEAVVRLNNQLKELQIREEREIERILAELSGKVGEVHDSLQQNMELLAELDFVFAKSTLAHQLKCTLPRVNKDGFVSLKKARHPLLAHDQAVPIDLSFGREYTSIIITGPNTGGKTVSLKTVGLLGLMTMAGLYIPAQDGSEVSVFDGIYADIGDEQSIEQNLSTFSSHLTNIIRILEKLTPQSLVLLDELGAGTDPSEGSALAIALLEHIHRTGCRLMATTHYGELKAYAYETEGVINASMEFDVATLSPTYRLMVGVPGRSNAFSIAEQLGLSKSIIEQARAQIGEEGRQVDSMIASLEQNRISAEKERESAEAMRAEVQRLKTELQRQQQKFDEQKDKLLKKAEEDARLAVDKARKQAEEVIADLRRMALEERASIKEHKLIDARKRLDAAIPQLAGKDVPRRKHPPAKVQPGDEVLVRSLGKKGHVVELTGSNEAMVQLGIMKMKVKRQDLEKVAESAAQSVPTASSGIRKNVSETLNSEIDLRGSSLEDSIMEVDKFLDQAILSNLSRIYIIHGKGTGTLRSGIQEYLRKHKHVESMRLGGVGEGGSGVTVAELK